MLKYWSIKDLSSVFLSPVKLCIGGLTTDCCFMSDMLLLRTSCFGIESYLKRRNNPLSPNILQFSNIGLAFECTVRTPTT